MNWGWKRSLKWNEDENDDSNEMKMKMTTKLRWNDDENWSVGGWGGFPPIKIKFFENWNENES